MNKILVILGATASGKTRLAVSLAQQINGEIISADSRQVYKGLDIGSGKDLLEYGDIDYHLIDILDPGEKYSAARFQHDALTCLKDIIDRRKIPIICGGTGHYIKTLLEDYEFVSVASNPETSKSFESLSREELYERIKQAGIWNTHPWTSDSKRRMARALEKASFRPRPRILPHRFGENYVARLYATRVNRDELRKRIRDRLETRIQQGLLSEVERLIEKGIDATFLDSLGLEYRWTSRYLNGEFGMEDFKERLYTDICRFAKRQETFLRYLRKSGHEIHDIESSELFIENAANWLKKAS